MHLEKETIMLFDVEISGHHTEYLCNIINFIADNRSKDWKKYKFIVHTDFYQYYMGAKDLSKFKNIEIIPIQPIEFEAFNTGNSLYRSIKCFQVMNRYAVKYKADHVILLHLNLFQLPLIFLRKNYSASGILFHPFRRSNIIGMKNKIAWYRKYWQTLLISKNPKIINIFLLNDRNTVECFNNDFKTNKFKTLPDPVPELVPEENFSIRKEYHIPHNRKILLHFGSLTNRKGTLEILDSYFKMDMYVIEKICLLIVGKASDSFDEKIREKIERIEVHYPRSVLRYQNEFVSSRRMKALYDQCYAVLIPYKLTEASSGVFGHAMASSKPMLGVKSGLLGELIEINKAGVLIDKVTSEEVGKGITLLLSGNFEIKNNSYIQKHTVEAFARTLLEKIN